MNGLQSRMSGDFCSVAQHIVGLKVFSESTLTRLPNPTCIWDFNCFVTLSPTVTRS